MGSGNLDLSPSPATCWLYDLGESLCLFASYFPVWKMGRRLVPTLEVCDKEHNDDTCKDFGVMPAVSGCQLCQQPALWALVSLGCWQGPCMQCMANPPSGTHEGTEAQRTEETHPRLWSTRTRPSASGCRANLVPQGRCCPRGLGAGGPRLPAAQPHWPGAGRLSGLSNTQCQDLGPVSCLCL